MIKINHLAINSMIYCYLRAALQIFLQSIILKPLKMLMAKLYLHKGWTLGGRPTLYWAGVGGGTLYHKKINKWLRIKNKNLYTALLIISMLFNVVLASEVVDQNHLKTIEDFLSSMDTLEAEITMDIDYGSGPPKERYDGKIWLDRKNKLLRINYGKSFMIAKSGMLMIKSENERQQEFSTEDTPAGLLLRPSINFKSDGITVKSLTQIEELWVLSLAYDSPAGSIPVTMYFKPKPVMLLMGWTIQNPNGSITNVHLNPDKTHMAIVIPQTVFQTEAEKQPS